MVVLARPRYQYDSYWDLYELAKLSEIPICYFDEIDWHSSNVYIVSPLNGELPNPLPAHQCRMIWLNIERPSISEPMLFGRPDFDEVWVCDRDWATRVGARFFVMGSHTGLGRESAKWFDWISCTYNTNRRQVIWNKITDLSMAPNGWPDTIENRAINLAASKLYVVPQQDEPPHCVTPLRFAIAAAYKLPMVYEAATNIHPFVPGVHCIHGSHADFPDLIRRSLADYGRTVDIGKALHQLLCCETDFKRSIEAML